MKPANYHWEQQQKTIYLFAFIKYVYCNLHEILKSTLTCSACLNCSIHVTLSAWQAEFTHHTTQIQFSWTKWRSEKIRWFSFIQTYKTVATESSVDLCVFFMFQRIVTFPLLNISSPFFQSLYIHMIMYFSRTPSAPLLKAWFSVKPLNPSVWRALLLMQWFCNYSNKRSCWMLFGNILSFMSGQGWWAVRREEAVFGSGTYVNCFSSGDLSFLRKL